jgi:hypothetical protein
MQVYKIIYILDDDENTSDKEVFLTTNEDFDHSWLCEVDQEDLVKCDEKGKNYDQKEWESK